MYSGVKESVEVKIDDIYDWELGFIDKINAGDTLSEEALEQIRNLHKPLDALYVALAALYKKTTGKAFYDGFLSYLKTFKQAEKLGEVEVMNALQLIEIPDHSLPLADLVTAFQVAVHSLQRLRKSRATLVGEFTDAPVSAIEEKVRQIFTVIHSVLENASNDPAEIKALYAPVIRLTMGLRSVSSRFDPDSVQSEYFTSLREKLNALLNPTAAQTLSVHSPVEAGPPSSQINPESLDRENEVNAQGNPR